MLSFETALATGQMRRAIIVATNIGNGTSLNAHERRWTGCSAGWIWRGRPAGR
jgi:hypothetical protein